MFPLFFLSKSNLLAPKEAQLLFKTQPKGLSNSPTDLAHHNLETEMTNNICFAHTLLILHYSEQLNSQLSNRKLSLTTVSLAFLMVSLSVCTYFLMMNNSVCTLWYAFISLLPQIIIFFQFLLTWQPKHYLIFAFAHSTKLLKPETDIF